MAVNRYPGPCSQCGARVPALGGNLVRVSGQLRPVHLCCDDVTSPTRSVVEFRFSSGEVATRNVRGRCEDAPCCGCCTF